MTTTAQGSTHHDDPPSSFDGQVLHPGDAGYDAARRCGTRWSTAARR